MFSLTEFHVPPPQAGHQSLAGLVLWEAQLFLPDLAVGPAGNEGREV